MSNAPRSSRLTRRQWLHAMGRGGGGAGVYAALSFLGLAEASPATPEFSLGKAPKGATVLVIGAGVAGLVSALELQRAGYQVQLLEYNDRPGGRSWTLRGGDRYTELGGATQHCQFDRGEYLNPGPWRLPYHHHGVLSYCKQLGVAAAAVRSGQSQRLCAQLIVVRRPAAALAQGAGRLPGRRGRTAGQGGAAAQARTSP